VHPMWDPALVDHEGLVSFPALEADQVHFGRTIRAACTPCPGSRR
jgi:hypothetical protein